MKTITISVPDIHCDHCKTSLEGATRVLDGVVRSEVDISERAITVEFDPDGVSLDVITSAIEDQGYEVAP